MDRQFFFYYVQQTDAEGEISQRWVQSSHNFNELMPEGWTLVSTKSTKDKKVLVRARHNNGESGTFLVTTLNPGDKILL